LEEASTVQDMARRPRICFALDNKKLDHQASIIEVEGMIFSRPISILINLGACKSYVDPKIVEQCKLKKSKYKQSWLVQLAIGTKRKVYEMIIDFPCNISK